MNGERIHPDLPEKIRETHYRYGYDVCLGYDCNRDPQGILDSDVTSFTGETEEEWIRGKPVQIEM